MLIEALDELVDGTKGAAFPLIRADLHLSYTQVGLLIAAPLLVGGLIELPLGLLAGYGARRNQLVLVGGVLFAASLCVVAFAGSFGVLLAGLVAFFPASGAFVGLTQAALMDADLPMERPPPHANRQTASAEPQPPAEPMERSAAGQGSPAAGRVQAAGEQERSASREDRAAGDQERSAAGQGSPAARGVQAAGDRERSAARGRRPAGEQERSAGEQSPAAMGERRVAAQQQRMASWNLAGSIGAVAGPILLAAVLTVGGTWRSAYLLLAGVTGVAIAVAAVGGPARRASSRSSTGQIDGTGPELTDGIRDHDEAGVGRVAAEVGDEAEAVGEEARVSCGRTAVGRGDAETGDDERVTLREALAAVRSGNVARWLILLEVTDLLLDVLTGYIGIYLVDVVHASPADAALGVAIRLGGGLAGDALFVIVSRRVSGKVALSISAAIAAVLYPAFLLTPWFGAKLAVLAVLSVVTACWYPVVQAGLYASLPGRSGIAVSWSSAAGIVGAVGPLIVGLVAQRVGLTLALAGLVGVPVAVLAIVPRAAGRRSRRVMR